MPGNIIQLNRAKELEWYVGDSKMKDLIEYLGEIGCPILPCRRGGDYRYVAGESMRELDSQMTQPTYTNDANLLGFLRSM